MGREVAFGIVIKAKNEAGGTLKSISGEAEKMGDSVNEGAEKGKKGLELLGGSLTGLNQGLSLAKKAWHALSSTFDLFIDASMKQRAEGDKQKHTLEQAKIQIERITGLIGDLLIPVIVGIADGMKPVLDAAERYLKTNKEMLGSGVIEWFQSIALLLVRGVAGGVLAVTAAWNGWKEAIGVVVSLASAGFAEIIDGVNVVLGGARELASAFGQDDMVMSIVNAQNGLRGLAKTSRDTSDEQLASAARAAQSQEQITQAIAKVEQALERGIGEAGVRAHQHLGEAVKKIAPNYDEWKKKVEALEAAHQKLANKIEAAISSSIKMIGSQWEQAAKAGEDALKRLEEDEKRFDDRSQLVLDRVFAAQDEIKNVTQGAASFLMSSMGEAFDGVGKKVDGHVKSWGDAFKQLGGMIGKMILQQAANFVVAKGIEMGAEKVAALFAVKAAAVEGGSKAVAAHAGIPFVGLAIGAAAAAAIVAAIMSFAGKMHGGGIVPDSGGFGDRHLTMLERGELVVPRAHTPAVLDMMGASGGRSVGGTTPSGGGGGGPSLQLNVSMQSLGALDRAHAQRQLESGGVLDVINDWIRAGKLRIPQSALVK